MGLLVRNPEELLNKDTDGRERVLQNPIVSSQLTDLFSPIISSTTTVEGFENPIINERLTTVINGIPSFGRMKEQLLYAYITGIRIIELIWGVRRIDGVAYNVPVDFRPHNETRFAYDLFGNLWMTQDGYAGRSGARNNIVLTKDGGAKRVAWGKCLVHKYRDGDGRNGYGKGEELPLYRLVRAWETALSYWLDYAQNFAQPVRDLAIDKDFLQGQLAQARSAAEIIEDELEAVENLIGGDAYAHDSRNTLTNLDTPGNAAKDLFDRLLGKIEESIRFHITGETVTSKGGSDTGSEALARVVQQKPIGRRRSLSEQLDGTLTDQLLEYIIRFNGAHFPVKDGAGRVHTVASELSPADKIATATALRVPVLKSEIYSLAELTEPTDKQINAGETIIPGGSTGGDLGPLGF